MSDERRSAAESHKPTPRLDLAALMNPARDDATLEERILWRCARVALNASDPAEVASLGARLDEPGWERLVTLARADGVVNLLFTHITAAGLLPNTPEPQIERMRQDYGAVAISTRRLEITFASLLPRLQEVGARVIVVKGLALARRLYGDIALRPISDIDLIAHLEEAPKWTAALRAAGFTPVSGKSQPLSKHVLRFREMQFSNTRGQTIEIHVNICRYPAYQGAFPMRDVWARARPLDSLGGYALGLAPADEVAFLCMHYAVQHQIGRLIWLTDVAEIARRIPDNPAWDALVEDAITRGVAAPVAVTLARAQALLDAPIPIAALERLRVAALLPPERQAWASASRPMSGARWYLSQLAVVRTPKERATLLWNGGAALARRIRRGERLSPPIPEDGAV